MEEENHNMSGEEECTLISTEANPFAKSGKLARSPGSTPVAEQQKPQEKNRGLNPLFTPKATSSKTQEGRQPRNVLKDVIAKINALYEFVKDKANIHKEAKSQVLSLRGLMRAAEKEQLELIKRAEKAEEALTEALKTVTKKLEPQVQRPEKRDRDSPGENNEPKKPKDDLGGVDERNRGNDWRTMQSRKKARKSEKNFEGGESVAEEKRERIVESGKQEKPKPRRPKIKGDALIIEAKESSSYADILKKVRGDPELKQLGENVVRTRRTQNGELLFELKKDPTIKSSAFKELVGKALGDDANVRALSQEMVIECKDLDEITTADEVEAALLSQCGLVEEPISIRLRKAYGGMQTASLRLSVVAATKLLEKRSVKIGWAIGHFRALPPVPKQMERCFRCMGFGHRARVCNGPDRTRLCRKCGEEGHVAKDCMKQPKCMLCAEEVGNDHMTGGFKCPVYQKARAVQQ